MKTAHDGTPEKVPPPLTESPVVVFDNVCNLCSSSVQFILRHNTDQSIKFLSAQSEQGQQVLAHYNLPTSDYETMLYIEDGQLYTKSDAALRIAARLSLPWRLLRSFRIIPKAIRDWVYDRIARNRYRLFGKSEQCFIPDQATRRRFLDSGANETPPVP